MRHKLFFVLLLGLALPAFSGAQSLEGFGFEPVVDLETSRIKNQQRTGTCWSFSCTSFLESELMRMGKPSLDLSEMYSVRHTYLKKADRYLRFHGKANFSEGALGHDVINAYVEAGAMPESAYDGRIDPEAPYDHSRMVKDLKTYLDSVLENNRRRLPSDWETGYAQILDAYLGMQPDTFSFEGQRYTARSFADSMVAINPDAYVSLTSFTHHPYYQSFVLEVPDNFSHGAFYNLPLDELVAVTQHALKQGYSIEWDGDVSEKGFSARRGLAIVPAADWGELEEDAQQALFEKPVLESMITPAYRQEAFDTYRLTDDHLMHLTGLVKDKTGKLYVEVKNSWGEIGPLDGYLYMSDAYFRYGTVSILLPKEAIPEEIAEKIKW
jgi:bleomycin hydrolase